MHLVGTFKIPFNVLKALTGVCDTKGSHHITRSLHFFMSNTRTIASAANGIWFTRVNLGFDTFEGGVNGETKFEFCVHPVQIDSFLKQTPRSASRYNGQVSVTVLTELGVTKVQFECLGCTQEIYDINRREAAGYHAAYRRLTPTVFSGEKSCLSITVQSEIKKYRDTISNFSAKKGCNALLHTHNGGGMVMVDGGKDVLICAMPLKPFEREYNPDTAPDWAME